MLYAPYLSEVGKVKFCGKMLITLSPHEQCERNLHCWLVKITAPCYGAGFGSTDPYRTHGALRTQDSHYTRAGE